MAGYGPMLIYTIQLHFSTSWVITRFRFGSSCLYFVYSRLLFLFILSSIDIIHLPHHRHLCLMQARVRQ